MESSDEEGPGPRPRAIVFDVDGTLYAGGPVRRGMLLRLALGHCVTPWRAPRVVRGLGAFRRAQETLRGRPCQPGLHRAQLAEAERLSGVPAAEIDLWVRRWMEDAPLALVARARRPGLVEFLERARAAGIRLGVLSDYPPVAKLDALGVREYFAALCWAQREEVGAFKPDPAGLRRVLADLDCQPSEALYVGDRHEVDGAVATAAGVACKLFGPRPHGLAGFAELAELVFGTGRPPPAGGLPSP